MDHKDLDAWKQAMLLVEDVYKVAAGFRRKKSTALRPRCAARRYSFRAI